MSRIDHWSKRVLFSLVTFWLMAGGSNAGAESVSESVAPFLQRGQFAEAEKFLQQQLTAKPDDAEARFASGVVRVLAAIERLAQDQYRFGALSETFRNVPVFRLPIPSNPAPEPVTYPQVRQVLTDFQTRLSEAEAELAKVTGDVKLRLDLATIRLDLTGSGEPQASFLGLLAIVNRRGAAAPVQTMQVAFDNGDVLWLRGYCHFLMAFCDGVLAYDHQRMFDFTGQLIYPRHVPSEPVAASLNASQPASPDQPRGFEREILDVVAAIHLMNFSLREPGRMESARQHLLEMIRTSRQSWALIQNETDDDAEWLPNPKQTGVLRIPVTSELIDGWHGVLAEMEGLLEGRLLVPFWRDYQRFFGARTGVPTVGRGVNLKRFFSEPRQFDLILMIQGSGALPYVEEGPLSRPETWTNLQRTFGGQFFGFAVWFN